MTGPSSPPGRRRELARSRACAFVLAIAAALERQGIRPRPVLVFKIARVAGAPPFRRAAGLCWLADRRAAGRRKLTPRTDRERSRRILVAVFLAIEAVDGRGRGIVARARRAARAGGVTFGDHDAAAWLRRFHAPAVDRRNLKQYRAAADAVRERFFAPRFTRNGNDLRGSAHRDLRGTGTILSAHN